MKTRLSRRDFLKAGAVGAAVAGWNSHRLIGSSPHGPDIDILITGGVVYDGLARPGYEADVAVRGDKILAIAPRIDKKTALSIIEARDCVVCPGFIDAHSHSDEALIMNPGADNMVRQGVTTVINGNCGSSPFPVSPADFEVLKAYYKNEYGLDPGWTDIRGYFKQLINRGMAVNVVQLLGQGAVRGAVMGNVDRPPTEDELTRMKAIVADGLEAGAAGLSTGLEYPPGSYARTREIIELVKEVGKFGRMYATHLRNEDDSLLEAMAESIEIAKMGGARLEISHLKTCYPRTWPKIDEALALLDQARKNGLMLQADCYPYTAGATTLAIQFPLWAQQGTTDEFLARLRDPALDEKIRSYVREREKKFGSWERLVISSVKTEKNKHLQGKNVLQAAVEKKQGAYEFMRDLLVEEQGSVGTVNYFMSEDNLKKKLRHPLIAVGSDGAVMLPTGKGDEGMPHPRSFGTFPRVLGRYAREEKVLSMENGVQKMTSLTARHFGLARRGELREGFYADLVVFEPDKILDQATYQSPQGYPKGLIHVIVNGRPVIKEGEPTGQLPGRVITPA